MPPPTAPSAHDAGIEYGVLAADIAADNMADHIAASDEHAVMTDSTAEGFTLVGSSEATILPYQEQQQNAWPDYSPSRLPSMNASEAASQQPSVVPASELSAMVQAFMEDAAGSAERECDAAEDADALAFKSIESFNILCVGESGLGKSTFLRDIFAHLDPTKFHEARRRVAAQRDVVHALEDAIRRNEQESRQCDDTRALQLREERVALKARRDEARAALDELRQQKRQQEQTVAQLRTEIAELQHHVDELRRRRSAEEDAEAKKRIGHEVIAQQRALEQRQRQLHLELRRSNLDRDAEGGGAEEGGGGGGIITQLQSKLAGTELSRRLDALHADGWQRVDVDGDGNCFFHALAKQVYWDEQLHGRARQETIRYMREHREEFDQFVHAVDFDSYVDRMSRDGTYVEGELELRAAANAFNVRIRVYGRSEDHDRTFAPLISNDETRDVCMAHDQAAQHYYVLERMDPAPIARGGLPRTYFPSASVSIGGGGGGGQRPRQTTEVSCRLIKEMPLFEGSRHGLDVTLIDTPGYGDVLVDSPANSSAAKVVAEVKRRIEAHVHKDRATRPGLPLDDEKKYWNELVHLCLFFVPPHRMKRADVELMTRLHELVPLVVVIAKADTMTKSETREFKAEVRQQLQSEGVRPFAFDPRAIELVERLHASHAASGFEPLYGGSDGLLPWAVMGSDESRREYLWGTAITNEPTHSELPALRDLLLRADGWSHLKREAALKADAYVELQARSQAAATPPSAPTRVPRAPWLALSLRQLAFGLLALSAAVLQAHLVREHALGQAAQASSRETTLAAEAASLRREMEAAAKKAAFEKETAEKAAAKKAADEKAAAEKAVAEKAAAEKAVVELHGLLMRRAEELQDNLTAVERERSELRRELRKLGEAHASCEESAAEKEAADKATAEKAAAKKAADEKAAAEKAVAEKAAAEKSAAELHELLKRRAEGLQDNLTTVERERSDLRLELRKLGEAHASCKEALGKVNTEMEKQWCTMQ